MSPVLAHYESFDDQAAGKSNCRLWTSDESGKYGTAVALSSDFLLGVTAYATNNYGPVYAFPNAPWWIAFADSCDETKYVAEQDTLIARRRLGTFTDLSLIIDFKLPPRGPHGIFRPSILHSDLAGHAGRVAYPPGRQ
jgi:hypothetical protein